MPTIRPLNDYVFVEPIKEDQKTKGGVYLPDTAEKEKPMQGKVLAVGPGNRDEKGHFVELDVKVGDKILFTKYAPHEIKIDDKDYLVVKDDDILGVIE